MQSRRHLEATFQHSNSRPHNSQSSMRTHRVARSPASTVCTRNTADNDYTAILPLLRCCIWVCLFWCRLGHCRRAIFQRKEWCHRIGLEAFLQICRCCSFKGGRAEKSRRAHPDVKSSPGIQHIINEAQRLFFLSNIERVSYYLGVRAVRRNGFNQGCIVGSRAFVTGCKDDWRVSTRDLLDLQTYHRCKLHRELCDVSICRLQHLNIGLLKS